MPAVTCLLEPTTTGRVLLDGQPVDDAPLEYKARVGYRSGRARHRRSDAAVISEREQTRLLARTFFARIFESDLMPPGLPQVRLVISVFSFLAAPSLVLPLLLMKKYVWFSTEPEVRLAVAVFAVIALVLWILRVRDAKLLPHLRFDEEPPIRLTLVSF